MAAAIVLSLDRLAGQVLHVSGTKVLDRSCLSPRALFGRDVLAFVDPLAQLPGFLTGRHDRPIGAAADRIAALNPVKGVVEEESPSTARMAIGRGEYADPEALDLIVV